MNERHQWIKAGGAIIDCAAVLVELKAGSAPVFLENLMQRKIAAAIAVRKGIGVADAEIETALADFYVARGLFEPEQIAQWHRSLPIGEEELRGHLRERILHQRLAHEAVPEAAIVKRFSANPHEFARAEVNIFTFPIEGAASEFILAVREREIEPFAERLRITRRDAPSEIAATLFAAEPGELVGPVEADDRRYQVYRLLHREEAILDDQLKEQLRAEMVTELLREELVREPQSFLL
jgi:hypothetical protein